MAQKSYKVVEYDQRAQNQVEYQEIQPLEAIVDPLDQFGYSNNRLFSKNVRELARALKGKTEVYVALTSGGAVTTKLTFTDGVLTALT